MMFILLFIHIASGVLALISGLYAIMSKKKRGAHSKGGNIYFYSMLLSAITALLLTIFKFQAFLFAIALFTIYLLIGGKLALLIRRTPSLMTYWKPYAYFGVSVAAVMAAIAIYPFPVFNSKWIILLVFSGIQASFSISDLYSLPFNNRKKLIAQHINKMGGAYIATCTAFIVVNIDFLPPLFTWLGPSLIGSILITIAHQQRHKQQLQGA